MKSVVQPRPYGTLRTGDIEDSDVEDTTLIKISMESEGSQTNGSAIDWYKNLISCGKVSEEKIKAESVAFFMLKTKDKNIFKIRLEELLKMQRSTETSLMREVMKSIRGNGKQYVNPPEYFLAGVDDYKKRRLAFLKQ